MPGKALSLNSKDKRFSVKFGDGSALYREMVSLEIYASFKTYLKGLSVKSRVYTLWPTNLCIEKQAEMRIKYTGDDYKKVGIYADTGSKGYYHFKGNKYNPKTKEFSARIRKLGSFFLIRDDSSPGIRFRQNRKRIRKKSIIKIYISDSGTGVDLSTVVLKIDSKPVVWDYNQDKGFIEILRHNKIWGRGKHLITIQMKDNAGNKSAVKKYIYYVR
ncbi:hypothetical protein ACFL20_11875 [Spirochaetota bacterium]